MTKKKQRKATDPNPKRAKLKPHIVRKIRIAHADGASKRSLSRKWAVSPTTITQIVDRLTWRHIPAILVAISHL